VGGTALSGLAGVGKADHAGRKRQTPHPILSAITSSRCGRNAAAELKTTHMAAYASSRLICLMEWTTWRGTAVATQGCREAAVAG